MLTVLGYEGPQLRAYLLFLKEHHIRIQHLILLSPMIDVATKKPVARFLPKKIRTAMGLKLLSMRMNHWPNMIVLRHKGLYQAITEKMAERYNLPKGFYERMFKPFNWRDYADKVDVVSFNGSLKDPTLHDWLAKSAKGAMLYTGGGIVPAGLLGVDRIRVIHAHPGYLPNVRGAVGILWSALLRRKFGVSCFYMEEGIDTGELLFAEEQDMLTFEQPIANCVDANMLYRALFAFVDPIIRADALCRLLKQHDNYVSLPAKEQNPLDGETFHFMHPDLRAHVLGQFFLGWKRGIRSGRR